MTDACDLPMCGSEGEGRLGFGDEGNPTLLERLFGGDAVLMVACGRAHQAALTGGGRVFTFWDGAEGRLGHGVARGVGSRDRFLSLQALHRAERVRGEGHAAHREVTANCTCLWQDQAYPPALALWFDVLQGTQHKPRRRHATPANAQARD